MEKKFSSFPEQVSLRLDTPSYRGSVQNLYDVPGHPDLLVSETTAGGSVFDVGTIFNIEGSDVGRAGFRHLVFQELQDTEAWKDLSKQVTKESVVIQHDKTGLLENMLSEFCNEGAPTHHVGMIDRQNGKVFYRGYPSILSNLTLIKRYKVSKPELKRVLGWHFYDYEKYHHKDRNVIPLEYIVRLGVTSGSSILRKFNRLSESEQNAYLNELGADSLSPWTQFDFPLVDMTTKYEPEDRNISRQEAALISGIDGDTFSRSLVMAILGAYLLQNIFSRMGLFLWDLKWEIARDGDTLVFVDTIDTDSVRVTMNIHRDDKTYFVHFNKQAMRDYYKIMHPEWVIAVNDAKKIAAQSGRAFTEILHEGQVNSRYPGNPEVDNAFLYIQKEKFAMIQRFILEKKQDMTQEARRIAQMELDYYVALNKRTEYEALNAVSP